jgi:sulfatase maturation enzyme AslB (radical SAM superfamily)
MEYNSKTFCSAPWFQIRKEINDEYRSCCQIDPSRTQFNQKVNYSWPESAPVEFLDSQYVQYLRYNLNHGVQLPECQLCWMQESLSQPSLRQIINNTVTNNQGQNLDKTWIHSYFKQKTNFKFDRLVSTDIKVSNFCNFSCAMCDPADSSQIYTVWQKNQYHPIVQAVLDTKPDYLEKIKKKFSDSEYDYLDSILSMCPTHVKLLGGEPLIDKILLKKLANLDSQKKSKISLLFVTNGSIDLIEFSKLLPGYKQINYVVSIDGIGTVQDYIRRGSTWAIIEKNILNWNATNRPVDIAFTLQCFNAMGFPDLYKWCQKHHMKFTISTVESPEYLSVKAIPPALRDKIFAKYQSTDCWTELEKQNFKQLITGQPYDPALSTTLSQFVNWYDPSTRWKNIFPEWADFIS